MLIIFVYATILLVYDILFKIPYPSLSSSHQNSSQSCVGLVLLGSPTEQNAALQRRRKSWEQLGVSDSSGWQRQGGLLRFHSGSSGKGYGMCRNATPPYWISRTIHNCVCRGDV